MEKRDYKIIAFDLDGTFLNTDKSISPMNIEAVTNAAARGVYIVPTTGRTFDGVPQAIRELPFVRYLITANGAGIYDLQEQRHIYTVPVSISEVLPLHDFFRRQPCCVGVYYEDGGYMQENDLATMDYYFTVDAPVRDFLMSYYKPLQNIYETLLTRDMDILKYQVYFRYPEYRTPLFARLAEEFPDMVFTTSVANNIECNHKGADKGTALNALCGILNIDIADTIGFGDGANDIALVAAAGLGVAMENAIDDVKKAANMTTLRNDDAGVGIVINQIFGF